MLSSKFTKAALPAALLSLAVAAYAQGTSGSAGGSSGTSGSSTSSGASKSGASSGSMGSSSGSMGSGSSGSSKSASSKGGQLDKTKLKDYGLNKLIVPKDHGGQGLGAMEDVIVLTEFAKSPRRLPGGPFARSVRESAGSAPQTR